MKKLRTKTVAPWFQSTWRKQQVQENNKYTFEDFKDNPVSAAVGGGAASGTAQTPNALLFPNTAFEYAPIGTQTITAPSKTAVGLDIGMDQTNNDGVEVTQGNATRGKHAYTIGTDGPFFFRVKFKIEDVSGSDQCAIGFRKVQAYQAAVGSYTDHAMIGSVSGDIKIDTLLNNAGGVVTDTTQNWADGETHTLAVYVSAAGVVTYQIDDAAPVTTAAFTFDSTDVVVPFMWLINDSDVVGKVELIEWECGLTGNGK